MILELRPQVAQRHLDTCQRVAQLVGDRCGELAGGGQTLGARQGALLLQQGARRTADLLLQRRRARCICGFVLTQPAHQLVEVSMQRQHQRVDLVKRRRCESPFRQTGELPPERVQRLDDTLARDRDQDHPDGEDGERRRHFQLPLGFRLRLQPSDELCLTRVFDLDNFLKPDEALNEVGAVAPDRDDPCAKDSQLPRGFRTGRQPAQFVDAAQQLLACVGCVAGAMRDQHQAPCGEQQHVLEVVHARQLLLGTQQPPLLAHGQPPRDHQTRHDEREERKRGKLDAAEDRAVHDRSAQS